MVRRVLTLLLLMLLGGGLVCFWFSRGEQAESSGLLDRETFIVTYLAWADSANQRASSSPFTLDQTAWMSADTSVWKAFLKTYQWYQTHPESWLETNQEIIRRLRYAGGDSLSSTTTP